MAQHPSPFSCGRDNLYLAFTLQSPRVRSTRLSFSSAFENVAPVNSKVSSAAYLSKTHSALTQDDVVLCERIEEKLYDVPPKLVLPATNPGPSPGPFLFSTPHAGKEKI
mgnify:FL=1